MDLSRDKGLTTRHQIMGENELEGQLHLYSAYCVPRVELFLPSLISLKSHQNLDALKILQLGSKTYAIDNSRHVQVAFAGCMHTAVTMQISFPS